MNGLQHRCLFAHTAEELAAVSPTVTPAVAAAPPAPEKAEAGPATLPTSILQTLQREVADLWLAVEPKPGDKVEKGQVIAESHHVVLFLKALEVDVLPGHLVRLLEELPDSSPPCLDGYRLDLLSKVKPVFSLAFFEAGQLRKGPRIHQRPRFAPSSPIALAATANGVICGATAVSSIFCRLEHRQHLGLDVLREGGAVLGEVLVEVVGDVLVEGVIEVLRLGILALNIGGELVP